MTLDVGNKSRDLPQLGRLRDRRGQRRAARRAKRRGDVNGRPARGTFHRH